jgi:hypothetical protein
MPSDYGREPRFAPHHVPEAGARLSRRLCLLLWAGIAGAGWGLVGLAIHLF